MLFENTVHTSFGSTESVLSTKCNVMYASPALLGPIILESNIRNFNKRREHVE